MNKNMTEEELSYYNTLSTAEKISYTLKHKTEEQKQEATRKRLEAISQWSEEKKQDLIRRTNETKKNKTEEEKRKTIEKFRKTMSEKSPKEIADLRRRQSETAKKQFRDMSDEDRKKFSHSVSEAYHRLSDEVKKNRVIKGLETKKNKYGENCLSEFYKTYQSKMVNTNMERYGVPYGCMLKSCRSARGGNVAESSPNIKFRELLEENKIPYIQQEFNLGKYSFDFQIDEKTLVEINPTATHNSTISPFNSPKTDHYHYDKTQFARDNGFRCINIWDWDNIDAVINILRPRESVGARDCEIKSVSSDESSKFLSHNHIQGDSKSSIRIGLYYESELVSMMTFGKPRYNKNYEYELIRYCSSMNVHGGSNKLFRYFVENYKPTSIISYCDLSKFDGKTYDVLGFTLKSTSIGKHWYNVKTHKHITDNLLRQHGFDRLLGDVYGKFGKGTSNSELMKSNGFVEIYDCGQATYIWKDNQ